MNRRQLLARLAAAMASAAVTSSWTNAATAKDGGGDGGGGGGGGSGSGGGRGGGDGDGGGRGGDNSGPGRGDDSGRGAESGSGKGRGGDDDGGRGRGRGRGGDDVPAHAGWGTTSPENAREAVSQGWALALNKVLPTVAKAVPGQVLEVDLRQSWSGVWFYQFLVLTQDRRYREVVVDARSNQVVEVRRR